MPPTTNNKPEPPDTPKPNAVVKPGSKPEELQFLPPLEKKRGPFKKIAIIVGIVILLAAVGAIIWALLKPNTVAAPSSAIMTITWL